MSMSSIRQLTKISLFYLSLFLFVVVMLNTTAKLNILNAQENGKADIVCNTVDGCVYNLNVSDLCSKTFGILNSITGKITISAEEIKLIFRNLPAENASFSYDFNTTVMANLSTLY
ncbi:MAG: hypothetical protein HQK51_17330 [Oligoflexia bacterium]|nr:hypothetical protein [Oligoflexia bacterium]